MNHYWAALCRDGQDAAHKRRRCSDEHATYMRSGIVTVRIGGSLLADESGDNGGSLLLIESNDRDDVECFLKGSPFFKIGVWSQISIQAFSTGCERHSPHSVT